MVDNWDVMVNCYSVMVYDSVMVDDRDFVVNDRDVMIVIHLLMMDGLMLILSDQDAVVMNGLVSMMALLNEMVPLLMIVTMPVMLCNRC